MSPKHTTVKGAGGKEDIIHVYVYFHAEPNTDDGTNTSIAFHVRMLLLVVHPDVQAARKANIVPGSAVYDGCDDTLFTIQLALPMLSKTTTNQSRSRA